MHTKTTPGLAFDSICPVEVTYKGSLEGEFIEELNVLAAYANKDTKETFGKAVWRMDIWSPETTEAFKEFLRAAEKDMARVLYVERSDSDLTTRPPHAWEKAETEQPLTKPKGLGE